VELEFPLANIGQRIGAGVLDFLAQIFYFLFLYAVSSIFSSNSSNSMPEVFGWVTLIILLLPVFFYFPLCEYFLNGQTVGKSLLNIRVVRKNGDAATLGDVVLRWLLRVVDVNLGFLLYILFSPFVLNSEMQAVMMIYYTLPLPLVGLLSMVKTKHAQRIGDLVANTVVIRTKRMHTLEDTILQNQESDYEPHFLQVLELSDSDIYIIKKVVEKAEKKREHGDVIRLAEKAREKLNITEEILPLVLLKTLLKDYTHLAQKKDTEGKVG